MTERKCRWSIKGGYESGVPSEMMRLYCRADSRFAPRQRKTALLCTLLLIGLFRRRSKKTSMLRVTGFCERDPSVTGGFPSQRANNAENVSIWWRLHVKGTFCELYNKGSTSLLADMQKKLDNWQLTSFINIAIFFISGWYIGRVPERQSFCNVSINIMWLYEGININNHFVSVYVICWMYLSRNKCHLLSKYCRLCLFTNS